MQLRYLVTTVLVLTGLLSVLPRLLEEPVQAQVITPATWQPIARISPQKPYHIRLINQTSGSLEFASTTSEFPPRKLQAGATTTLTQLPVPIYLLISPVDAAFQVRYTVFSTENVITVRILPVPEGRVGHSTLNIQENGGIYIY